MFEVVGDEEEGLVGVDFEGLVDDPFESVGVALDVGGGSGVFDLVVGAEEAGAVDLDVGAVAIRPSSMVN